jgi:hypothetical protein
MRRVFLQKPGVPIAQFYVGRPSVLVVDPSILRAAAVALANFAVDGERGRDAGDPVYDWVTENRRKENERRRARGSPEVSYSSCGDLGNWLLMCLGVRDERIINRDWDGGVVPWKVGANVSRLVNAPGYVRAEEGALPKPGDVLHISGDAPNSDHIMIFVYFDLASATLRSYDYGQPYGRQRDRKFRHTSDGMLQIGDRILRGWIDLERLVLTESAIVPPDFEGGIADDNPYEESLYIPPGVP